MSRAVLCLGKDGAGGCESLIKWKLRGLLCPRSAAGTAAASSTLKMEEYLQTEAPTIL